MAITCGPGRLLSAGIVSIGHAASRSLEVSLDLPVLSSHYPIDTAARNAKCGARPKQCARNSK